jgi:acyl carrier protein
MAGPIEDKLRAFLAPVFRGHTLMADEDIFALGFVNSLFALQLVQFLEREFGITIDNEDLDIDNFRTINALAALVTRKQSVS